MSQPDTDKAPGIDRFVLLNHLVEPYSTYLCCNTK